MVVRQAIEPKVMGEDYKLQVTQMYPQWQAILSASHIAPNNHFIIKCQSDHDDNPFLTPLPKLMQIFQHSYHHHPTQAFYLKS